MIRPRSIDVRIGWWGLVHKLVGFGSTLLTCSQPGKDAFILYTCCVVVWYIIARRNIEYNGESSLLLSLYTRPLNVQMQRGSSWCLSPWLLMRILILELKGRIWSKYWMDMKHAIPAAQMDVGFLSSSSGGSCGTQYQCASLAKGETKLVVSSSGLWIFISQTASNSRQYPSCCPFDNFSAHK